MNSDPDSFHDFFMISASFTGSQKNALNSLDSIHSSILEKSEPYNPTDSVRDEEGMENYWFIAKDWLSKDRGCHQMFRDLAATTEDGRVLTRLIGTLIWMHSMVDNHLINISDIITTKTSGNFLRKLVFAMCQGSLIALSPHCL